jgi:hypothetical protein
MATMDAQQIYDNFHTLAKGTQGLAAAAQTAQELAAKYQDRALTTQRMIDTLQSGWRGAAAEAASQGLAPLAENALNSHQQLGTGQDIVSRQVDSFHTAASQVQPVPPAPSMTDVIKATLTGHNPVPILDQMANHHAIQHANVDAYNRYVGASQYNTTNLPPLTAIDDSGAPVSVTRPVAAQATASPVGTQPSQGLSARAVQRSSTAVAGHTSRSSAGTPARGGAAAHAATPARGGAAGSGVPTVTSHVPGSSSATTTSSAAPPPTTSTGPGIGSNPVGNGPVPAEPIAPVGGGFPPLGGGFPPLGGGFPPLGGGWNGAGARSGSGALPGDGPGPVGGAGPVRGGAGALDEPGPGVGVPRSANGSSLGGRSGSGARTGGLPGEGTGGRSGAVSGSAEEEALALERGGAVRPGGQPVVGPMGGGRRRDKDAEHKRRYGLPEDGEQRFGIDELSAPPVIGETAAEREQRDAQERARHSRDY